MHNEPLALYRASRSMQASRMSETWLVAPGFMMCETCSVPPHGAVFLVCRTLASFFPATSIQSSWHRFVPNSEAHINRPGRYGADLLARSRGPHVPADDMAAPGAAATVTARLTVSWPCQSRHRCLRHHQPGHHTCSPGAKGSRGRGWRLPLSRIEWTLGSTQFQSPHRHLRRLPCQPPSPIPPTPADSSVEVPGFGRKGEGKDASYGLPVPEPQVVSRADLPPEAQQPAAGEARMDAEPTEAIPPPIAATTKNVEEWIPNGFTQLVNLSRKVPPEIGVLWRGGLQRQVEWPLHKGGALPRAGSARGSGPKGPRDIHIRGLRGNQTGEEDPHSLCGGPN